MSGLGPCGYCGRFADVAIRCACGVRVAYCAHCAGDAAIALEDHAADCPRAAAALEPSGLVSTARLLERLQVPARLELLAGEGVRSC